MKLKFKIGDWVTASHVVEFVYETDEPEKPIDETVNGFMDDKRLYHRRVHKTERVIYGQIVGGTTKPLGEYRRGYSYGTMDGYEECPPYLEVKGTAFVYFVREGFTNNPVEVLEEDLQATIPLLRGLPMRKSTQPPINDKYREMLREFAKEMPRKNGRFVKQ